MKLSVAIPTYRRAQTLRTTLAALLACSIDGDDYEVIVVDDGQDPDTEAVVAARQGQQRANVVCVANTGHGAAAARNTGARHAQGEVVLFLDDDMRVQPDHLRLHLETRSSHPDALIGGRWSYSPESFAALQQTPFGRYRMAIERGFATGRGEHEQSGISEVGTLPACDLSIVRERFWELGGFDESFPYAGAEDQDFATRASRAGLQLLRNNDIPLLHDEVKTTLRQFARREERGAHTVHALVRRFPEYEGDFHKNRPLTRNDSPSLIASKLGKYALSREPVLSTLLRTTELLERTSLPDRLLWPLYRVILGLYIFRGYRDALRGSEAR